MKSELFSINLKDISKALVMAVLIGAGTPILAILQAPGFDIATANWSIILHIALNGAIVGFVGYILKNFVSDDQGKVFGRIG